MRTILAAALAAAALTVAAKPAPQTQLPDSTEQAVATFIASNFKVGIGQVLGDLQAQGLELDSARVVDMVIRDLAGPYNETAHQSAYEAVTKAVESARTRLNEAFLDAAKAREGAQVTPSGLVFETRTNGVGEHPKSTSTVAIRYRGSLPDGTVFDEITPDQDPMVTPANRLVPGMTEGITMMQPGGNYVLTIPAALAYGDYGAGGVIPPATPLRFDVELVEIINE